MTELPLPQDRRPRHIAIIMDGNGRWAESRGQTRSDGHRAGVEAVKAVVRAAREWEIPWLTLYAFSSENWSRPRMEIRALMKLPDLYFETELANCIENGIRIRCIGQLDRLPKHVRKTLSRAILDTRDQREMQLVFALSYGARGELVDAARRLAQAVESGRLSSDAIDEKTVTAHLDDPELPDVDLLIRTGGEARVSNFLLWQSAYAELYFTDTMWPDFDRACLAKAIDWYGERERRFGRTSAQLPEKCR